jgi:hypothetical protein
VRAVHDITIKKFFSLVLIFLGLIVFFYFYWIGVGFGSDLAGFPDPARVPDPYRTGRGQQLEPVLGKVKLEFGVFGVLILLIHLE